MSESVVSESVVSEPIASPSFEDSEPLLSAVVVHWSNEEEVAELLAAWPDDPRLELLVIDNSSSLPESIAPARKIDLGRNLGFAGGVNRGVAEAKAPWVLILNPDLVPKDDALANLLQAIAAADAGAAGDDESRTAGVVPALEEEDGGSQCAWQLRPLPGPGALILQTLLLPGVRGPEREPPAGTAIEQPAGAALALRREVLEEIGGLDERFQPAWFEDVDLAFRLRAAGHVMRYAPSSRWVHQTGGSVPSLGYGRFLRIYYRNLGLYLQKHHPVWAPLARCTLATGMLLRMATLPLRRPRRAVSRLDALQGLYSVLIGALTGRFAD